VRVRRLVGLRIVIADIVKTFSNGNVFGVQIRPVHTEVQPIFAEGLIYPEIVIAGRYGTDSGLNVALSIPEDCREFCRLPAFRTQDPKACLLSG